MMGARAVIALTLAVALAGSAGCGSDSGPAAPAAPVGPVPGVLTASLTTPNADDRAILISIRGTSPADSVSDVQAVNPAHTLHSRIEGGNFARAVLLGDLASGALVRFSVPDVNRIGRYTASVVQVADPANVLRSTAGYTLQLSQ